MCSLHFPSLVVELGLESELETGTEGVESRIIRAVLAKKTCCVDIISHDQRVRIKVPV